MPETLEQEARRLRDIVYSDSHGTISDEKWERIKTTWTEPSNLAFLRERANNPLRLTGFVPETEEIKEPETKPESEVKPDIKPEIPVKRGSGMVEKVC